MFFDMDLLCRQHKGRFAVIWLAATRGITHIRKTEIENVNIIYICEEILRYVMSNSTSPRNRLSLYLSAKLVFGAVLVFQQQVVNLEKSAVFFAFALKRPVYKCLPVYDSDEQRERNKRKKKAIDKRNSKKREEDQIYEQMLQPLPDINVNVSDIIHITLPEETSTRLNINEQELFGDEGQIQQQLAEFENIPLPNFPALEPEPVPPPTNLQEEAAGADKRLIDTVEDVEQSPSKRRRAEVILAVSPTVRVQEVGSLSPDNALMPPPPVPPPRSRSSRGSRSPRRQRTDTVTKLTDTEMIENITGPPIPPRTRTRRRILSQDYSLFHFSKWQVEDIYKRIDIVGERKKRLVQDDIQLSPNGTRIDPADIIEEILGEIRQLAEDDIHSVVRHIEQDVSLEQDTRQRLGDTLLGPEITVPIDTTPAAINVVPDVSLVPSPRLSRIAKEIESFRQPEIPLPEPEQQVQIPEDSRPEPRIHTSTPTGFDTEAKRHFALLSYLRDIFSENNNQPILIDHIVGDPPTRYAVATTFNALLHLMSQQFVRLTTHPDSLELYEIYPGIRL